MTLNVAQLRDRVAKSYPNAEQVSDSIVRFTREDHGRPFAVYYLDVAPELPGTPGSLTEYQDRVLGRHYFEGKQSLQWSNYLYFLTSRERLQTADVRHARELIEADRKYARKFVISEEELDSVLNPPVVSSANLPQRTNVLSNWTTRLTEAGLDRAILSDDDLPKRLALIESSSPVVVTTKAPPAVVAKEGPEPFLRSFNLVRYREFPLQRAFEFGTVNLIFGPNATGKTSLLEAIELFYCGRNRRNPDRHFPYELKATFADGKTETAKESRQLREFRRHNLIWYGQPEVKTNNLYHSFSQFNFLDTDAAVNLALADPDNIEDDLSKLLIGPDASRIWRNIERVSSALSEGLREPRALATQIQSEMLTIDKQLKESAGTKQESDAIGVRLNDVLRRAGWPALEDVSAASAANLVEALSALIAVAHLADEITWTESPVTIQRIQAFCQNARKISEEAKRDIERLEAVRVEQKRVQDTTTRGQQALGLIRQIRNLLDAAVPHRNAERDQLRQNIATYSASLGDPKVDFLSVPSTIETNVAIEVFQQTASARHSEANGDLARARMEYEGFSKLRDQSINLAQQLRDIAARILEGSAETDRCPLCHTEFKPGELKVHMSQGLDRRFEERGRVLLNQQRAREERVRETSATAEAGKWLVEFCQRTNVNLRTNVSNVLLQIEGVRTALKNAQSRLATLTQEIEVLEGRGLSLREYQQISSRLNQLGYDAISSVEGADKLISSLEKTLASSTQELRRLAGQADELQKVLQKKLDSTGDGVEPIKRMLSQLGQRLATAESLQARLSEFSASYPWSARKSIAELAVAAEFARKMAADLLAALRREESAKTTQVTLNKRKEQLDKQLASVRPRVDRFEKALAALQALQKDHSLSAAMKAALNENRTAIEAIFARIHAPPEFSSLGSTITTLLRKSNNTEAKLSEISTGQRASLGLSVFLAKNSQLTTAPPVVLIDDPIAHVDDLNSLSFLDYLREIALAGRRQILFATANDKLAALFQRKFDFLGVDGFRRFDLTREGGTPFN